MNHKLNPSIVINYELDLYNIWLVSFYVRLYYIIKTKLIFYDLPVRVLVFGLGSCCVIHWRLDQQKTRSSLKKNIFINLNPPVTAQAPALSSF